MDPNAVAADPWCWLLAAPLLGLADVGCWDLVQREPSTKGAALGGFAHDTGESGLSEYHLRHGGDLVREIGTGYFGSRQGERGNRPRPRRPAGPDRHLAAVPPGVRHHSRTGAIHRRGGEPAGGKPTGFKLCAGSRRQFLAVCKAMLAEGATPDFLIVDGAEGGTGPACATGSGSAPVARSPPAPTWSNACCRARTTPTRRGR